MIRVEQLTKRYGPHVAVDDISFEVGEGEIFGFLGPNGAGKTTTLRIVTGFIAPTRGSVTVAGFDLFTHSLEARRRVGYLPENVPLYGEMRVREYLAYRARLKEVPRREVRARVDAALERKERNAPEMPEGYNVPAVAKEFFKAAGGEELLEKVATESALGSNALRDQMPREKPPTE